MPTSGFGEGHRGVSYRTHGVCLERKHLAPGPTNSPHTHTLPISRGIGVVLAQTGCPGSVPPHSALPHLPFPMEVADEPSDLELGPQA
ncbi:hypothetical protein JB92DRAFT_3049085 [Gautieria morchelliformis]|nr:hypothetical protein JB92DRAFT_3049085 [Gautieria morchelliformis]